MADNALLDLGVALGSDLPFTVLLRRLPSPNPSLSYCRQVIQASKRPTHSPLRSPQHCFRARPIYHFR